MSDKHKLKHISASENRSFSIKTFVYRNLILGIRKKTAFRQTNERKVRIIKKFPLAKIKCIKKNWKVRIEFSSINILNLTFPRDIFTIKI